MMMKKKLRFAVLGTGFWSTLQIPAWFEAGNVELVALYNRTVEKARKLGALYDVSKVYSDPAALFENEKLDFVDIITEVPIHEKLVKMAAAHRVHVICQKPMSYDYKSCLSMVQACKQAGVRFIVHENFRSQPRFRQFKEILSKNPIGRIRRAELNYSNRGRSVLANQPFVCSLPHYIITDFGSHLFDLVRYLFGSPKSLYCTALKTYEELAGEDSMVLNLKYEDKLVSCAVSEKVLNQIYIDGEKGALTMDNDNRIILENEEGKKTFDRPEIPKYSWAGVLDAYQPPDIAQGIVEFNETAYKALATGESHENEGSENLKVMEMVYAACQSAEDNSVQRLSCQ